LIKDKEAQPGIETDGMISNKIMGLISPNGFKDRYGAAWAKMTKAEQDKLMKDYLDNNMVEKGR
jgi:hypothetical protein